MADVIEIDQNSFAQSNGQKRAPTLAEIYHGRALKREIRAGLAQALKLKRLAFEQAELLASGSVSEEQKECARDAVGWVRVFTDLLESIRVLRGKPGPGNLRPAPSVPKPKVRKFKNSPPDLKPLEADCVVPAKPAPEPGHKPESGTDSTSVNKPV